MPPMLGLTSRLIIETKRNDRQQRGMALNPKQLLLGSEFQEICNSQPSRWSLESYNNPKLRESVPLRSRFQPQRRGPADSCMGGFRTPNGIGETIAAVCTTQADGVDIG